MSNTEQMMEILRKAFQIEVDGYTFYSMTAERAEKPAVRELFEKLAQDEVQHQAFLKSVAGNYHEKGLAAFTFDPRSPDMRNLSSQIFTGKFREQASGSQFELGVLSIGMTLEQNAVTYFSSAANAATDKEIKDFYQFLADWEKQHLDALQNLHMAVRQDFWAESGFSPF